MAELEDVIDLVAVLRSVRRLAEEFVDAARDYSYLLRSSSVSSWCGSSGILP